jgi:hypothetical protein
MASWLEEIERRESVARERIEQIRAALAELTGELEVQERVLSRLEITRETMTEILARADGHARPVPGWGAYRRMIPALSGSPSSPAGARWSGTGQCGHRY